MRRLQASTAAAVLLATLAFFPAALQAGPVPGVETITKRDVSFPTSPSTRVWEVGEDDYLVTFRWKPEFAVTNPGVAGDFNNWDRADLPMEGPDEEGYYTVTARIPGGDYRYKFVSGNDGWHTDPANPVSEPDNYGGANSLLRLGITALLSGKTAQRGDGEIEERAFLHDPAQSLYFDLFTPQDVTLRFRTVKGDADAVELKTIERDGDFHLRTMQPAASDAMFDYYEYHVSTERPDMKDSIAYTFIAKDGEVSEPYGRVFPLVMDPRTMVNTPEWAKHAIWYQIMVDRWRDGDPRNNPEHTPGTNRVTTTHPWKSEWYTERPYERANGQTFWQWSMYNRLYGGDFKGLIDTMDYLVDLGVTAIYLNPVFEATSAHKYNAKSYIHADDGYGVAGEFAKSRETTDELDSSTWEFNESDKLALEVIEAAHERGMKIIFDGVFNHLADDSWSFMDVREKGRESRYADWYHIDSWEPFSYTGWAGFGGLPEFEKTAQGLKSKALEEHIFAVTTRWMDPNGDGDPSDGIDGWRLDVPMHLPKPFWQCWRDHVKSINPEAYIVGEIWDPAEHWLDGTTFDAVMNYQFAQAAFRFFGNKAQKTTASQFDDELARLRIRYPRAHTYVLQNLYDSHDTDRTVSRLANPDLPYDGANRLQDEGVNFEAGKPSTEHYQRLRLMTLFQFAYHGAPMIYYGTEVGMWGADDPANRAPMWWEDMMPYESEEYVIDHELLEFFKDVIALRKEHEVLRTGDYATVLTADDQDVYAFARSAPDQEEAIVIVLNNSAQPQTVELPPMHEEVLTQGYRKAEPLFGAADLEELDNGKRLRVTLPPISGTAIRVPQTGRSTAALHQTNR